MFTAFLYALRAEGLPVGTGQWLTLLDAMRKGLITDLDSLYAIGRSILCRSEAEYDAFDLAYSATFGSAVLPPELREKLEAFLKNLGDPSQPPPPAKEFEDLQQLWEQFLETLKEQKEEHHGGNRWVGTRGSSPFGRQGKAPQGIAMGGEGEGSGGRSGIRLAGERKWAEYRTDKTLDTRDLNVALRALRNLVREGLYELDLDGTIDRTAQNAGDIELVEQRARENQVHLVLLMDAGGSMAPHYERVSQLFTAAKEAGHFKSFTSYSFHNCVYGTLYKDIEQLERIPTHEVLAKLTPRHRLIFVGDASMAPYELFSAYGWPTEDQRAGLEWLQDFRQRCRASIWLNPDPKRFWNHPTVSAIGNVFPMFELTLEGLRDGIKVLRAPL